MIAFSQSLPLPFANNLLSQSIKDLLRQFTTFCKIHQIYDIFWVLKNQLLRQFLKKKHFLQKREMKMELEHLIFSKGPQRVAPFSHAVRAGEYLFITGRMPTLKNDK